MQVLQLCQFLRAGPRIATTDQMVAVLFLKPLQQLTLFGVESNSNVSFPVKPVIAAIANDDLRIHVSAPGRGWDCDIDADNILRMFMLD